MAELDPRTARFAIHRRTTVGAEISDLDTVANRVVAILGHRCAYGIDGRLSVRRKVADGYDLPPFIQGSDKLPVDHRDGHLDLATAHVEFGPDSVDPVLVGHRLVVRARQLDSAIVAALVVKHPAPRESERADGKFAVDRSRVVKFDLFAAFVVVDRLADAVGRRASHFNLIAAIVVPDVQIRQSILIFAAGQRYFLGQREWLSHRGKRCLFGHLTEPIADLMDSVIAIRAVDRLASDIEIGGGICRPAISKPNSIRW